MPEPSRRRERGLTSGAGRHRILVVDDEAGVREGMAGFLAVQGYVVEEADSCEAAEAAFRTSRPDVAILDYRLPDGNALDLLPRLRAVDAEAPLLILTGHGTIDLAVRALKEGADQFLTKPVELPALLVVVERLLDDLRRRRREMAGRSRRERDAIDPFLGTSAAIHRLAGEARKLAGSDSPILIQGDTGTGKGVLAAWLHQNGSRADEAFVDLNCAGLQRDLLETELFGHERGAFTGAASAKAGLLEVAHLGTVFLDEIGDMDLDVQAKLLKVVEEKRFRRVGETRDRRVDVRLIAATHQDLAARVRERLFRGDLYFRISTLPIRVPALRERAEDVPLLAGRLLEGISRDLGRPELRLSGGAVEALQAHAWPGNVRELRNVLERAALFNESGRIEAVDLRFEGSLAPDPAPDRHLTLDELERRHVARVLEEEHGRVEAAARRLGIARSSLYLKIRKYGLQAGPRSPSELSPDAES